MTTSQLTTPAQLKNYLRNKSACDLVVPFIIEEIESELRKSVWDGESNVISIIIDIKENYTENCFNKIMDLYKSVGYSNVAGNIHKVFQSKYVFHFQID